MQAFCRVAVAPLRKEASDASEMVSQVLFGEEVRVLEATKKWSKVEVIHDGYTGWVDPKQIGNLTENGFSGERVLAKEGFNLLLFNGLPLTIPMGCWVPNAKNETLRWGEDEIQFLGEAQANKLAKAELSELSKSFLNVPYLWGGRSHFGVDCSGFVQMVYRFSGTNLPRDAYQQAEVGEVLNFSMEAEPGDLAFFDNEEGRIIHVGILLSQDRIIHSHGCVRIDPLDSNGIFNTESQSYSHKLRFLRKILP